LLTWQEKLTLEDITRKHAQREAGKQKSDRTVKPPTPCNTTEVSGSPFCTWRAPSHSQPPPS
jgi:hypothetical protein